MKKNDLLLFLLLITEIAIGQNMVVNGDFEEYYNCPVSYQRRSYKPLVPGWISADGGTPDYFNACSHDAGVPFNWAGKNPSETGRGYVGIYTWGSDYREFIKGEISKEIIPGEKYVFSFQYMLARHAEVAIDRISAKIIYEDGTSLYFKYVKDSAIDLKTGLWETAIDTITATGREKYVIIGNFDNDANTKKYRIPYRQFIDPMLKNRSYYMIDNVSMVSINTPELLFEPDKVYTLKNVRFEFDRVDLIPSTLAELDQLVIYLNQNERSIRVTGHTDELGSKEYNNELSLGRARAVAEYLIKNGIARNRISIEGKGESEPISKEDSEDARAMNRRVEFIIN